MARSEEFRRVERARILLHFTDGLSIPMIAQLLGTTLTKVNRCVDKALTLGPKAALDEEQRSGRPPKVTPEAKTWVISLACQKPKELGYSYEVWTQRLLAEHVRKHASAEGHDCLSRMSSSIVSRLLAAQDLQPHKVRYYLERRDPDFDVKRSEVLCVYQQVEYILENEELKPPCDVYLSYDEKPGIQAISNTADDLPPVPGEHSTIGRDSEYKRHGTLSLLAGIDLVTGEVIGSVEERHRSREFVDFLKRLDAYYSPELRIQIILDNHSAHISKEIKTYLESVPNRFEFVFTPKHGSWLNVIESFFAKMTKQVLRHLRVKSKEELKQRIELYLKEVNENPVPFRWKYGLEG
ncbi:IS630 family transposase [Paenibacillus dendritiformis]|uniref:IS630 family transposase n=1 Tax=Paenibacillus dendritiformis TaxID=130049 RepID=UPI00387E0866